MIDKIKKILKEELLGWEPATEDFNPMDWSGGNFDDCYDLGVNEGRCQLANELLDMISHHRKEGVDATTH